MKTRNLCALLLALMLLALAGCGQKEQPTQPENPDVPQEEETVPVRLVCSNGMVVNEAAARRNHVGRVTDSEENFSVYSQATLDAEDKAFVMKIQDTVRAAVEEARFAQVVGKMQEAKAAQMDTRDVPAVVKLASKEFHITDSESTGVLQRLIESNDLTLYGLSNAVTRHSQDVESYDRASELESIGYSILTMPTQQWSRINQAAA